MSQRNSEYARVAGDIYVTPRWVYDALYEVEPWAREAWDCAPVNADFDFLDAPQHISVGIATNPPFSLAERFCHQALISTQIARGKVAMLLSMSFDTAKGRRDLFANCPMFKCKYAILKRIRWENLEQKKAGPSQNHAWYVWDWNYSGPPMVGWLPLQEAA